MIVFWFVLSSSNIFEFFGFVSWGFLFCHRCDSFGFSIHSTRFSTVFGCFRVSFHTFLANSIFLLEVSVFGRFNFRSFQFSIFFKKGDPFDLEHWQTPVLIDTQPYEVITEKEREVTFRHAAKIKNYSDTDFFIRIDRTVRLLDRSRIDNLLGLKLSPTIDVVGYESENILTNINFPFY